MIAGKVGKSNVLGQVGAFPIPEVLQGINAFTRGARSVNPNVQVRVIRVNSRYEPGKEREAAMTPDLAGHGHRHPPYRLDRHSACGRRTRRACLRPSLRHVEVWPRVHLTATTLHWGEFRTRTMQSVLDGSWEPASVWGGFKEGMIRLAPLNPAVPADVKATVAALKTKLKAKLKAGSFHPCLGPVIDQSGKEHLSADAVMDDIALGKLSYFVQGVTSKLPNTK